jgi:hypothetical protein
MSSEGFLTSNSSDTTWTRPYGKDWKQITYAPVDGLAVFEGCIILGTVEEMQAIKKFVAANPGVTLPGAQPFGAGIKGTQYRWKDNTIPYEIDADLENRQRVDVAIDHWRNNTPMKFVLRDANNPMHQDYVVFRPGDGCASSVGRRSGRQEIILGSGCSAGNCIHEIGHTVGLWHEQSRIDRETYITINWASIMPNTRHNFDQHILDGVDLGNYDYESIMHYPKDAFSADGKDTIIPKQADATIGQRVKLSAGDIAAVRKLITI